MEAKKQAAKPANHNRPWTDKERAYVRKHRGKISLRKIAAKLGRTRDACAMSPKYKKRPRRLRREYPDFKALGMPCQHPHFQKAGFSASKRRTQMWRCVCCRRTTITPPHIPEPRAKKSVPMVTKRCPECGAPVTRRETHHPDRHWFCCVKHGMKWHNTQRMLAKGKRGSRKNRRGNDQRRWTEDEIAFLRDNHNALSYEEMGLALCRGAPAIQAQCLKHGFGRKNYWTKAEEQFLIANQHRGWKWCGEQLGRGRFAVSIRANAIGLRRYRVTPGVLRGGRLLRQRRRAAQKAAMAIQSQQLGKALEAIK